MKLQLPLIAAFAALLSLSACGGASDAAYGPPPGQVVNPPALTKTDISVGVGAEAATGKTVKVHYTGWLYNAGATGFKGLQFDSSSGKPPYQFKLGSGAVIPGFDQGILGMKVGGKRTVLIPSTLGYGASGYGNIPPNTGLVFEIELIEAI
jgi:FKBP-type peptidyl-prolyl cis-trans isomerase FkpA